MNISLLPGPQDLDLHANDPELVRLMRQRQLAWVIAAKIAAQWDLEDEQTYVVWEKCKLPSIPFLPQCPFGKTMAIAIYGVWCLVSCLS